MTFSHNSQELQGVRNHPNMASCEDEFMLCIFREMQGSEVHYWKW